MNLQMPGEIYQYIVEYKTTHDGNSPTVREIQEKMDISSTSMVAFYLGELEAQRKIRKLTRGKIAVIGGRWGMGT